MRLAYVMPMASGSLDLLLADVAQQIKARGLRLCGALQVNTDRAGSRHCDMDLIVLPDGPGFRISQYRGTGSRGCRLDQGVLETAVMHVAQALACGADMLILNKFGKHEAEGRGFRTVIAAALERDIPVLVGLNPLNREAFDRFSGGLASEVGGDISSILDWAGLSPVEGWRADASAHLSPA